MTVTFVGTASVRIDVLEHVEDRYLRRPICGCWRGERQRHDA
jgi:hypothetical protein